MIRILGAPTTNTHKVTIALAELGLGWEERPINLAAKEQCEDWFLELSPNNKVPVLEDKDRDLVLTETGAILCYLAETYDPEGKLLPKAGTARYAALQGAFFQAAHIGPNLGRLSDQLSAPDSEKIPEMIALFFQEATRLVGVLDRMLGDNRDYLAGPYSVADIMHYPWLKAALERNFPPLMQNQRIRDWLDRLAHRPQVLRGMRAFQG